MTERKEGEVIFYAYHVVTERPMALGQVICMDADHPNGVGRRVAEKTARIDDIYRNPEKYRGAELEHHTAVALRELAMEEVRLKHYPQYPSRMACLYVSEQLEDAFRWAQLFQQWGRPTYQVVKLKIHGTRFTADAENCFTGTADKDKNLAMAMHYWKNLPNAAGTTPIREMLVSGTMEVVEIVHTYHKEENAAILNRLR